MRDALAFGHNVWIIVPALQLLECNVSLLSGALALAGTRMNG